MVSTGKNIAMGKPFFNCNSFPFLTFNGVSNKPFIISPSYNQFRFTHTRKITKQRVKYHEHTHTNRNKSFQYKNGSNYKRNSICIKKNYFTSDSAATSTTAALGRSSLRQHALFEKGVHFIKRVGVGVGVAIVSSAAWVYYVTVTDKYKLEKKIKDKEPEVDIEKPESEFHHPYADKPWWWKLLFIVKRYIFLFFTLKIVLPLRSCILEIKFGFIFLPPLIKGA